MLLAEYSNQSDEYPITLKSWTTIPLARSLLFRGREFFKTLTRCLLLRTPDFKLNYPGGLKQNKFCLRECGAILYLSGEGCKKQRSWLAIINFSYMLIALSSRVATYQTSKVLNNFFLNAIINLKYFLQNLLNS